MKVLFAIEDESNIIDSLARKYKIDFDKKMIYTEAKNFTAIMKEIQQNNDYDRIIISEDFDQKINNSDKKEAILLKKIKGLLSVAKGKRGKSIPVIFLGKNDKLVKYLMDLNIYNFLIGKDVTKKNIYELIKTPRNLAKAKAYYKLVSKADADEKIKNKKVDAIKKLENKTEVKDNISIVDKYIAYLNKPNLSEEKYISKFESACEKLDSDSINTIVKSIKDSTKRILKKNSQKYNKFIEKSNKKDSEKQSENKKRGRGRPRKVAIEEVVVKEKKKRGRPRKNPIVVNEILSEKVTKKLTDDKKKSTELKAQKNSEIKKKAEEKDNKKKIKNKSLKDTNSPKIISELDIDDENQNKKNLDYDDWDLEDDDILLDEDFDEEDDIDLDKKAQDLNLDEEEKELNLDEEEDDLDLDEEDDNLDLDEEDDDLILDEEDDDLDLDEEDDDSDLDEENDDLDLDEEDDDLDLDEEDGDLDLDEEDDDLDLDEEYEDLDLDEEDDDLDLDEEDDDLDLDEEDDDLDLDEEDDDLDLDEEDDNLDLDEEESEDDDIMDLDDEEESEDNDIMDLDDEEESEDDDIMDLDDEEESEDDDIMDLDDEEESEDNDIMDLDDEEESEDDDIMDLDDEEKSEDNDIINLDEDSLKIKDKDLSSNEINDSTSGIKNKNYIPNFDISKQLKEINNEDNTNKSKMNNKSDNKKSLERKIKIGDNQKIVSFVGSRNSGNSFLINNIAHMLSEQGVKTAIVDLTKNKNSYYIYTENEENLRSIAYSCFEKLKSGIADGIKVNKNLTVYTSLPNSDEEIENKDMAMNTLLNNYSLILLDCDFDTNLEYFNISQEIYFVQSLDILTIQTLTGFIKKLQMNKIEYEDKMKIVINKYVNVSSINEKAIVAAISVYNSPDTTYQLDLFDRNKVEYFLVPFEEKNYCKYLDEIIRCKLSIRGYSKNLLNSLNKLAKSVYPINGKKYKSK